MSSSSGRRRKRYPTVPRPRNKPLGPSRNATALSRSPHGYPICGWPGHAITAKPVVHPRQTIWRGDDAGERQAEMSGHDRQTSGALSRARRSSPSTSKEDVSSMPSRWIAYGASAFALDLFRHAAVQQS
jgi:hypothetical protein